MRWLAGGGVGDGGGWLFCMDGHVADAKQLNMMFNICKLDTAALLREAQTRQCTCLCVASV